MAAHLLTSPPSRGSRGLHVPRARWRRCSFTACTPCPSDPIPDRPDPDEEIPTAEGPDGRGHVSSRCRVLGSGGCARDGETTGTAPPAGVVEWCGCCCSGRDVDAHGPGRPHCSGGGGGCPSPCGAWQGGPGTAACTRGPAPVSCGKGHGVLARRGGGREGCPMRRGHRPAPAATAEFGGRGGDNSGGNRAVGQCCPSRPRSPPALPCPEGQK